MTGSPRNLVPVQPEDGTTGVGPFDEQRLLDGLRNRDETAVRELVSRYGNRLLRGALLLLRDYHTAEDVVQETFVAALYNIDQFEGRSSLYTWIYQIAVNECRMRLRRRPLMPVENVGDYHETPPSNPFTPAVERQRVTHAIGRLGYVHREAIVLYYYVGMTVEEIATAVRRPAGTVKARLSRARQRLRQWLSENDRLNVTDVERGVSQ